MTHEYSAATDTQGTMRFKTWFDAEWSALRTNNDMDFLVEARNATIHQEPARPRAVFTDTVGVTLRLRARLSWVLTKGDGTIERGEVDDPPVPQEKEVAGMSTTAYFFTSLPPKTRQSGQPMPSVPSDEIVTVCRNGLCLLESLVSAAEGRFKL